jgi:ABC-type oligopeptide transport system substrate-binding subunit
MAYEKLLINVLRHIQEKGKKEIQIEAKIEKGETRCFSKQVENQFFDLISLGWNEMPKPEDRAKFYEHPFMDTLMSQNQFDKVVSAIILSENVKKEINDTKKAQ